MKFNLFLTFLILTLTLWGVALDYEYAGRLGNSYSINTPHYTPTPWLNPSVTSNTLPTPTNTVPSLYKPQTCFKFINQTICE
jgi:hypothetical protein